MTLVSSIIHDAYRETNLIPGVATPNTVQTAEALRRLNSLILSTVGNEAGDELTDLNYGGDYDQSTFIDRWLPDDVRLVFNLSAAASLDADPYPYEGQRLSFVDASGNLATYNVVIDGNGRTIEGAASVTLNTNSDSRQWMYRADTGNWVKIEELEEADEMPFPVDFDDYFIVMLAMRLNPKYGQLVTGESARALTRSRTQLRARYRSRRNRVVSDPGLVKRNAYDYSDDSFNFGQNLGWYYGY